MNEQRDIRSFLKTLRDDESGAFAVFLTLTLPVTVGFAALAVDASYLWTVQNELQIAADAAALAGAQYVGSYSNTTNANPCSSTSTLDSQSASPYCYYAETLANANQPIGTSGTIWKKSNITFGTWSSSGSSGTFTALGAGPYANAVKVTVSLNALPTFTPMLSALINGANFTNLSLSATATATYLGWPQNLTFNLQGAKGFYYKTVTLYALPFTNGSAATTYTNQFKDTNGNNVTGQWIYTPTSQSAASGSGNVNVGPDIANKQTTLNLGALGSGSGNTTGPTTALNLGQYADVFMVESVMQGPCPQTTPWYNSNWGTNGHPVSCSATQNSTSNTQESIGATVCTESQVSGSAPAYASYNAICNPNAASTPTSGKTSSNQCLDPATNKYNNCNSSYTNPWQFMYVNFFPAETNQNTNFFSTSVSAATSFPCGQTVGHQWEDGGNPLPTTYANSLSNATSSSPPAQDFFYTVFTTCGAQPGVSVSGYYSATPTPQLVQ
jgi:Flp pilus assembly protein TadG